MFRFGVLTWVKFKLLYHHLHGNYLTPFRFNFLYVLPDHNHVKPSQVHFEDSIKVIPRLRSWCNIRFIERNGILTLSRILKSHWTSNSYDKKTPLSNERERKESRRKERNGLNTFLLNPCRNFTKQVLLLPLHQWVNWGLRSNFCKETQGAEPAGGLQSYSLLPYTVSPGYVLSIPCSHHSKHGSPTEKTHVTTEHMPHLVLCGPMLFSSWL